MSLLDFFKPKPLTDVKRITGPPGSSAAIPLRRRAKFNSSRPLIALVDSAGIVKLLRPGAATITLEGLDREERVDIPVTVEGIGFEPVSESETRTVEERLLALEAKAHRH